MTHNVEKCPMILKNSIDHTPAQDQVQVPRSRPIPQPLPAHWEEEGYSEAQSGYVTCSRSHIRQQSHGVKIFLPHLFSILLVKMG